MPPYLFNILELCNVHFFENIKLLDFMKASGREDKPPCPSFRML